MPCAYIIIKTCAAIDIKILYWYCDSKFCIDILVYRCISPILNVILQKGGQVTKSKKILVSYEYRVIVYQFTYTCLAT